MKVAIITDTHYGARKGSTHLHDYFQLFYDNVFFPTLEEQGIDTIIHMGDIFDSRKSIDYQSLEWSKKVVFDPMRKYKVYAITGNHDCYYKNTNYVNSPELLLNDYSNISTFSKATEINIDGLDILLLPWINSENYDDSISLIKNSKSKVAMGHLELNGFRATRGHMMENGMDVDIFDKFDIVYSGHFHTRSTNGKIKLQSNTEEMLIANPNGSVDLYFNDTLRLATSGIGATVFGQLDTTTLNVSGVSTFSSLVDVNNRLDVVGGANVDQLNISGVSTFAGLVDINNAVNISSGLVVTSGATLDSAQVSDPTDNRIVIAGASGELEDDANLTFNGTVLSVGVGMDVVGTINITGGVNASGVVTASSFNGDGSNLSGITATGIGAIGGLTIKDQNGSTVGTGGSIATLDFNGSSGVTVIANSGAAGVATIAITGGGGGGGAAGLFAQTDVGIHTLSRVGIGTTNPIAQLDVNVGTSVTALNVAGSEGQLFSVTNNLSSGSIFGVNDITGMPSIDVNADGTIQLAPFGAGELVGIGTTNPTSKLHLVGDGLVVGVITATSFVGDGTGLIGVASTDNIITSTASTFANINSLGIITAVNFNSIGVNITVVSTFDGAVDINAG